jgi:hypothetical protein
VNKLNIAEEYVRGKLCIILKVKEGSRGSPVESEGFSVRAVSVRNSENCITLAIPQYKFFDSGDLDQGRQNGVFVRVVETVENVEEVTRSAGERLKRLKHIFDSCGRCFYSATRGFKTSPVLPRGEIEPTVLCAAIMSDKLPNQVI